MSLFSLIYVSAAEHQMSEPELVDILEVARRKNTNMDITGILLYRDGFFIQVLEGEENKVKDLYKTIGRDPRHHHVLTVMEEQIDERSFGEWSMGFKNLDEVDPNEVEGFTDFLLNPDPTFLTQNPSKTRKLVNSFREGNYW